MNNQYAIDMNNLSFGDKPMNYEHDATGNKIFDNKGGTSISAIRGKQINVNSNNMNNIPIEQMAKQKLYHEQITRQKMMMAQQAQMQQPQIIQKQQHDNFNTDPQLTEYSLDNESMNSATKEIHNMAKDVNKSLSEYTTSKHDDSYNNLEDDNTSLIPDVLKEPLLIFILYVVLSQQFFKGFIFQIISDSFITNYNLEKHKTMIYIIIYGLILSILYAIAKKFIL